MTLKMCDLAWTKPAPSLLAAAGIHAASLYVGQDATGKNMNSPYVGSLAGAGVWTVTNFEYGASQMLGGYAQGVTDARLGLSQARACGMPAGRPIYYSADFDATAAQMADAVIPYLQGARSVTGPGTVGFYGGYPQVLAVLAFWAQKYPGERIYIWQSPAWSGGQWSGAADIRQQLAQETVGGSPIDIDYAYSADFGQWQPGVIPKEAQQVEQTDQLVGNLAVQGRTVGDVLADLSNFRDWWYDQIGVGDGNNPPANTSRAGVMYLAVQGIVAKLEALSAPSVDAAALATALAGNAAFVQAVAAALPAPPSAQQIAAAVVAQIGADLKPAA